MNCSTDAYIMAEYVCTDRADEFTTIFAHLVNYLSAEYDSIKVWTNNLENDISLYSKCGFITKKKEFISFYEKSAYRRQR